MRKHWYKFYITECPVCFDGKTEKERQYTERPEAWEERHEFITHYDWCLE